MLKKLYFLSFLFLGLSGTLSAQQYTANAVEFVEQIAAVKEINDLLFSYEHDSQRSLYVLNNQEFRDAFGLNECKMEVDYNNLPIYIECYNYIRTESILFYMQFDEITVHKHHSIAHFSTQGASPKGRHIEGKVTFEREEPGKEWTLEKYRIKDK